MHILSEHKCFDGLQLRVRHPSAVNHCEMTYSLYLPPQALAGGRVPLLYWLSGLTCTDENFTQKAGAQRYAAQYGLALVMPDTSPRGEGVPDDPAYDLGQGAGFYLNATQTPWAQHYHMYDYITAELPAHLAAHYPLDDRAGIAGHSMGGHGALQIALKNPARYAAVSAFAPIVNPGDTPWGQKAFTAYLGDDKHAWRDWDSTALLATARAQHLPIRIDAGDADEFRPREIRCETFVDAARQAGYRVDYHLHPGYDHSYYTIASYIGAHIAFHAEALGLGKP
ncbi:MAG: S-formylglutathione hydrolase [Cardiobacterium hominis]|jgi:S-formylglutathione hydrolase